VSVQVRVDLKELYKRLCPQCKRELVKLIRESLDEQLIEQMLS